eukprot:TRINITY_DN1091_c0_g1_i4.p1 TRINITY_DN1091_c0_g1~~TRINITY_DN1091_c0_g1_i4.p1  ORF type:complete len:276 (-),score=9.41 TRINITY_DN1091_c0_g1_i4:1091-1858(-)
MGGVVSVVVCLLCRNGCSASNTASELLFFPPTPPCYKIVPKGGSNDGEEDFDFVLDEMLEQVIFEGGPQVVKVKTRRKKTVVVLWYKSPYARYTLLHSHGNATDLGAMHDRYVGLVQNLGVSVVAYDYTGYGASSGGHPTEKDTYSDIEAVYQWVTTNCRAREVLAAAGMDTGVSNIPGSNVLLYGQSVGSGPTCYLASRERCAGVILHSPILSGMRVLTESRALGCLDVYPNIERIRKVSCGCAGNPWVHQSAQ